MRPPLGLRDYEVFSSKGNVFIVPDPSKGYPSKNTDSPFCVLGYNWRKFLSRQSSLARDLKRHALTRFYRRGKSMELRKSYRRVADTSARHLFGLP